MYSYSFDSLAAVVKASIDLAVGMEIDEVGRLVLLYMEAKLLGDFHQEVMSRPINKGKKPRVLHLICNQATRARYPIYNKLPRSRSQYLRRVYRLVNRIGLGVILFPNRVHLTTIRHLSSRQFEQLLDTLKETRGTQTLDIPASLKGFLNPGAFGTSREPEMSVNDDEDIDISEDALQNFMNASQSQELFTQGDIQIQGEQTQADVPSGGEQSQENLPPSQVEQSQENLPPSQVEQSQENLPPSQGEQSQSEESSELSDPPPGITTQTPTSTNPTPLTQTQPQPPRGRGGGVSAFSVQRKEEESNNQRKEEVIMSSTWRPMIRKSRRPVLSTVHLIRIQGSQRDCLKP
jgi:hypothetical protein